MFVSVIYNINKLKKGEMANLWKVKKKQRND